ncbi:Rrf2 family transcriptional regulator [bacterium]|nr:Rrf2 family transcriptional regulator [bacterium]
MGLQLSTRSRYGVRALCKLAENFGKDPLSIQTLSEEENIPLRYLEQIMGRLRRDGIVESIRGPRGGYWLEIDPSTIKMDRILKVLEGDISLIWCADDIKACSHREGCYTAAFWSCLTTGIRSFLGSVSLQQLLDEDWSKLKLDFKLSDGEGL